MTNDQGDRMVSSERSEQPVTFDRHPLDVPALAAGDRAAAGHG